MSERVSVFEVGPRDGLQNESRILSTSQKLWLVNSLVRAGLRDLEVGAFVRADRVPQMADTDQLIRKLKKSRSARFWSLVPNLHGLDRALEAGSRNIAVFTAATDRFTERNIGMSVRESLREFDQVIRRACAEGIQVRGYVSTAFGCPFEGKVAPKKALSVIERLAELGVCQVSIGDTIGVADPKAVEKLIAPALLLLGTQALAVHFHDTRGTALANALKAFELGVRVFDSSAGGLGGCPFALGASGNLATEDLVYMFNGMGISSGVELTRLAKTSLTLATRMRRPITSKYVQAFRSQME